MITAFRIYEKNSGNVDHHQQRIEELKSSYSEIKKIINEASDAGYNLEIRSTVEVNIISKDL